MSKLAFVLAMLVASTSAFAAKSYFYDADVDGMVCAFCAYNVSKRIKSLPGVDPGSVVVSLDQGLVQFRSRSTVDEGQIATIMKDTGFSMTALRVSESPSRPATRPELTQRLVLRFDPAETKRFESVLEAIGAIAASSEGQLRIRAPSELETELLKPMLAGRQQAIPVAFDAISEPAVEIRLLFDTNKS